MKHNIVNKLLDSFNELERAITTARATLEEGENPPKEILAHIESYEEILEKQRSLATALCGYASMGNWEEVSRHVRLINGLSAMSRDDAREVLSGCKPPLKPEEREVMLS